MSAKFTSDGLQWILESYFRGRALPSSLYVGLAQTDPATLTGASVLSAVTGANEVTGTGYARVNVTLDATGFPTSQTHTSTGWQLIEKACVFGPTGGATDWTGAKSFFVASSSDNSGKLIAWGGLAATRTLVGSDTETVTATLELDY